MADGKKLNKKFRLFYDKEQDILFISRKGNEEEFIEAAPGVNIEFDKNGDIIGIEIFRASRLSQEKAKKKVQINRGKG